MGGRNSGAEFPMFSIISKSTAAAMLAAATMTPLLAGEALARPDTRKMTCEGAQQFIRQNGAVVMTTGQYTYDRIVSNQGYCDSDEITWLKIAPTKDNPKCRVGYYCRPRLNDDGFIWRRR
jgi:hypothetical protein